jgi:hypothetical protein
VVLEWKSILTKCPPASPNMKAWELLLSESQNECWWLWWKGKEDAVLKIFDKWDLPCRNWWSNRLMASCVLHARQPGSRITRAWPGIGRRATSIWNMQQPAGLAEIAAWSQAT